MMRREPRPFVVERRKGQKRTAVVTTIEQQQPASPPMLPMPENALDEIFRKAEAALFDRSAQPRERPVSTPEETAAAKGRILENLNEVDPLAALIAERGQASRRGRKPGSKNKPKDASQFNIDPAALANLKGRLELTPERINEALKTLEKVSAADPARATKPTSARPVRPARPLRPVVEEVADEDEELMLVESVAQAGVAQAGVPVRATGSATEAKPRSRGTIRGRYVVGSELKPGERWKRRLRGAR